VGLKSALGLRPLTGGRNLANVDVLSHFGVWCFFGGLRIFRFGDCLSAKVDDALTSVRDSSASVCHPPLVGDSLTVKATHFGGPTWHRRRRAQDLDLDRHRLLANLPNLLGNRWQTPLGSNAASAAKILTVGTDCRSGGGECWQKKPSRLMLRWQPAQTG